MKKKRIKVTAMLCIALSLLLGGCGKKETQLLIAAAASLEYAYRDELIPAFEEKYPGITVEGTYDSSGKLQTQIEQGLEADVFMSAATKQMNSLVDLGLIDKETVVPLLENKIVLVETGGNQNKISGWEEIGKAQSIALGDPDSVPAGQYGKEVLEYLGQWDEVQEKASFGTNVTEVLNWVAEGSAEVGVLYATDAMTTDKVSVIAEAPLESLEKPVIYPIGVVSNSSHKKEAALFVEFLQSPEALQVFEGYGFTPIQGSGK